MQQGKNDAIIVKFLLIMRGQLALVVTDNYDAFLEVEKARKNI